jgi:hypothetical protein
VDNFDLSNPTWINIAHEGSVDSTPAAFDIMVPLIDGFSFLINGGLSSPQNVSEANQTSVFSTITKQWTAINSTTIAQTRQHRAVIDVNGRVWCWGGFRYVTKSPIYAASDLLIEFLFLTAARMMSPVTVIPQQVMRMCLTGKALQF